MRRVGGITPVVVGRDSAVARAVDLVQAAHTADQRASPEEADEREEGAQPNA